MKQSLLIARRELYAYVRSPLGAIIIAGALLLDAILLYWSGLSAGKASAEVLQLFFYNTSGVTMAAALFLSMRLLAEERQAGTMTLLNTAPVRDSEIVAGKFLAAFGMIAVMTALTFYMPPLDLRDREGERRAHPRRLRGPPVPRSEAPRRSCSSRPRSRAPRWWP